MLDLYVLLVEPSNDRPHDEIKPKAIELGRTLMRENALAERIGRIAWIEGQPSGSGLTLDLVDDVRSRFRPQARG